MSELSDSVAEAIRKRVVSAALGTYLFFWAAFHWEGIYTTFFTSQELIYEKFKVLKNEYVREYFFSWHGWNTVWAYVVPVFLTVLFIWPIPKYILIHAYRQEQRHKIDRRRIKIEEEERLEKKKELLATQTKKTIEAEIKTSKVEKEAAKQDPKILWKKEYEAFASKGHTKYLSGISEAVYKHGGKSARYVESGVGWVGIDLPKEGIAIAHTNDLIAVNDGRIALTDKGKYFLSIYMDGSA